MGLKRPVCLPSFLQIFHIIFLLKYIFILVNYRGSLGFGQTSLHSLPGNVGTQDVQDVQVWKTPEFNETSAL